MKEKMKYSKILLKELYAFKPTVFIAILLATLISAALPLLQLLLSAFVIQWLMEGVAIREYLLRLLVFIVLIGVFGNRELR